jgi:hypothetical protein
LENKRTEQVLPGNRGVGGMAQTMYKCKNDKKRKKERMKAARPVTHSCNPSYSGSRDQVDLGSKPAQANSSRDPISKYPFTNKGLVVWLQV